MSVAKVNWICRLQLKKFSLVVNSHKGSFSIYVVLEVQPKVHQGQSQIGWPNQQNEGRGLTGIDVISVFRNIAFFIRGFVKDVVAFAGEVGSKTRFSLKTASFVGLLVVAETVKQCSNYGVRYSNGGEYPVPQALHVTVLEVIKLAFTITMAGGMRFYNDPSGMDSEMEYKI